QYQRRYLDGAKQVANVDLHHRLPEMSRHRGARAGALGTPEELADAVYTGDGSQEEVGQGALAPMVVDFLQVPGELRLGEAPRVEGGIAGEARRRSVEHETSDPFRIRRREEQAQRPAFGGPPERRVLDPGRIHYGPEVVHPLVERRGA